MHNILFKDFPFWPSIKKQLCLRFLYKFTTTFDSTLPSKPEHLTENQFLEISIQIQ